MSEQSPRGQGPTPVGKQSLESLQRDLLIGLRDMIGDERLVESDIPDDFDWLCQTLEAIYWYEVHPHG